MTESEKLSDVIEKITGYLDDWDNEQTTTNDTLYYLLGMRKVLENMVKTEREDGHLTFQIVMTLYALDLTMSKILENEAIEMDNSVNNKLSLSNFDFTWKKEE